MITSWLSLCILFFSVLAIARSSIHYQQKNNSIKIYAANHVLMLLCWANVVIIPSVLPGVSHFMLVGIILIGFGILSFRQFITVFEDQIIIKYLFKTKYLSKNDIAALSFKLSSEDYEDAYMKLNIIAHDGTQYDITRFDITAGLENLLENYIEDKSLSFRKIRNHYRVSRLFMVLVILFSSILNVSYMNDNWVAFIRDNITVSKSNIKAGPDAGF